MKNFKKLNRNELRSISGGRMAKESTCGEACGPEVQNCDMGPEYNCRKCNSGICGN